MESKCRQLAVAVRKYVCERTCALVLSSRGWKESRSHWGVCQVGHFVCLLFLTQLKFNFSSPELVNYNPNHNSWNTYDPLTVLQTNCFSILASAGLTLTLTLPFGQAVARMY